MNLRSSNRHYQPPQIRMPNKPVIYFAGKITPNCWRHDLIPSFRSATSSGGSKDCGTFFCAGPFFVSCDHQCRHGDTSHGVLGIGCESEIQETRDKVFEKNQKALESADLVFAYIDASDCFGTLVELGWAARGGIPIFIVFGPAVDFNEFWYAQQLAVNSHSDVTVMSRENLPAFFRAFIAGMISK